MLNFNMDNLSLFETHKETLGRLFKFYCSFGEPLNHTSMKQIKFIRMMQECGLLAGKYSSTSANNK